MKYLVAISVLLGAAAICHPEPRWCSITGKGPNDNLLYPVVAKAAQVQGVVVSRILYHPNGKVDGIEQVFGLPVLAEPLSRQLMQWTLKTDASGDELCQTLVIAMFRILDPTRIEPAEPLIETRASVYRISVETEPPTIESSVSATGRRHSAKQQ